MPNFASVLRVATIAALTSGLAYLTTATAGADPDPAAVNALAGSLSKGYTMKVCAADTPPSGVQAVINCPQSPDNNGPAQGTYILFGNGDDMAGSFKASIKDLTLANCGDVQSPTTWSQQGTTAGQVACGTYQGVAEIIWSTTAKNIVSLVRASNTDIGALYQWWRLKG